jgi:hypothetical protein
LGILPRCWTSASKTARCFSGTLSRVASGIRAMLSSLIVIGEPPASRFQACNIGKPGIGQPLGITTLLL